ncbi:DUF3857 domain-containing protein [Dyadobacter flavalbus]|uniref:DUF3857 domain-containing protein n=1 Tax=Dyadobacter flavalbus TaxID=2579942 RepID=A0A5M8R0F8_9BACT|nr:DUF3857 domain-containing protein [Dyadobacter flavalbus]KAA6440446.1 DUF3857 domain-containing protein [Dyadobacter flavalbus]
MSICLLGRKLSCAVQRKAVAFAFLSFISFNAFSQEDFKPKFSVVDHASLEMNAYPGDSTADAVYLYDYGDVTFSYDKLRGIMINMDTWVRIKILKESALDRASVSLPYYDGSSVDKEEVISDLRGFTYNLEGGKIVASALDKKSVKREKVSDVNYVLKFNLPNVKKGSVIEYAYSRTTPLNVRDKPDTWRFQGSIPSKWSEYRIVIPHFLSYKTTMSGYLPLYINKQEQTVVNVGHSRFDGQGIAYRFVVKDAPAFVNEPYITTELDYLSKINFELSSLYIPGEMTKHYSQTWSDVEKTLDEVNWFGGELRKSSYLKEKRDEIIRAAKTPEEKMEMAYSSIQNYMKWDGYAGLGSNGGVRKAYDNRKGNATEINLVLTTLLRELELECNPVLLSTRSHGQIYKEIPLLESFNYVISHVQIGEKEYLLDATQPYAKAGLLPEHALNGSGRLIPRKGAGRFLDIVPKDSQSKLEMINAEIIPEEGSVKGNYTISYGGYEALRWRGKYVNEPENVFHEDLKKQAPEWTIQNIAVKNASEDLKSTVNVTCDFELLDENSSPDVFYFNPMMAGRWASNPLKSKDRIYPLDLTSGIAHSYIGNFKLPDGYMLEEIPKPEVIVLPEKAGKFAYQIRQTGNVIQVNSSLLVNKTRFLPDEYHDLKEFFERVVQKHAQPLVIKKRVN